MALSPSKPFINKGFDDDFFGMSMKPFFHPMSLIRSLESDNSAILRHSSPCYEIHEDENKFQLLVEVPGVKAEDMDVQVEQDGRVLRLTGGRKVKKGDEVTETHFEKSFRLGKDIDAGKITANLADGVLVVDAPKHETKKNEAVKIPIIRGPVQAPIREYAADHRLSSEVQK